MNKTKNRYTESGITLIALIITIIVLLILAAVTISALTGENGVLSQAINTVILNREAKVMEEVSMVWSTAISQYLEESAMDTSKVKSTYLISKNLNKYTNGNGKFEESIKNEDGTYTVKYRTLDYNKLYTFIIEEDGTIKKRNGLNFDKTRIFMEKGEKIRLSVELDGIEGEIKWSCSDTDKISLSESEGNDIIITANGTNTSIDETTAFVTITAKCFKDDIEIGEDQCNVMIGIIGKHVDYSQKYSALWKDTDQRLGYIIL